MRYWVRRRNRIQEATLEKPSDDTFGSSRWNEEALIRYRVAIGRCEFVIEHGGYDAYKLKKRAVSWKRPAAMADHASTRMTHLYDRRRD